MTIQVLDLVSIGRRRAADKYNVKFPCCGKEGVMTMRYIKRWLAGETTCCLTCSNKEKYSEDFISARSRANAEEQTRIDSIAKATAEFTKLMAGLNHVK